MPIYEYLCGACKKRVSLFFTSFTVAESRASAGENKCPRCGSVELSRVMSKAYTLRGGEAESGDFNFGGDGDFPGGLGEDPMGDVDQDDPRAVARWARQMKESMGPDLDMGPEFDRALSRIESGEDPEKVMDDVDPEALAGGGPGMAGDDFDDS